MALGLRVYDEQGMLTLFIEVCTYAAEQFPSLTTPLA